MKLSGNPKTTPFRVFIWVAVLVNILWAIYRFGGFEYAYKLASVVRNPLCKDCNVVLVTLDVCSAKNISCYGYDRDTAPNFCSYAKENVFFENAFANGVFTLPSHASIFTGLIPSRHGVREPSVDSLDSSVPLLSDVLYRNGYETLFYMFENDPQLPVAGMYKRGMTAIDAEGINTDYYVDKAMRTLLENDKKGKKTFLSLYSNMCHEPYFSDGKKPMFTSGQSYGLPQKETDVFWEFNEGFYRYLLTVLPIDTQTSPSSTKSALLKRFYGNLLAAPSYEAAKQVYEKAVSEQTEDYLGYYNYNYFYTQKLNAGDTKQMDYLKALYDQKIFEVDRTVTRKLRDYITQTPLKKNTIVIVTSEHGQEFGEHKVVGHTTLYDLNMKVPLMFSVPGIFRRSVSANVQSVDIMPTILDLVGIPHSYGFDGVSLVPLLRGKKLSPRILVADGGYWDNPKKQTLRDGDWKVFVIQDQEKLIPYELYNIKNDPLEMYNVLPLQFTVANRIIERFLRLSGK